MLVYLDKVRPIKKIWEKTESNLMMLEEGPLKNVENHGGLRTETKSSLST